MPIKACPNLSNDQTISDLVKLIRSCSVLVHHQTHHVLVSLTRFDWSFFQMSWLSSFWSQVEETCWVLWQTELLFQWMEQRPMKMQQQDLIIINMYIPRYNAVQLSDTLVNQNVTSKVEVKDIWKDVSFHYVFHPPNWFLPEIIAQQAYFTSLKYVSKYLWFFREQGVRLSELDETVKLTMPVKHFWWLIVLITNVALVTSKIIHVHLSCSLPVQGSLFNVYNEYQFGWMFPDEMFASEVGN